MAVSTGAGTGKGWAFFFIALYMGAVILPLAAASILGAPGEPPILVASLMSALAGFVILCLQVPLASRVALFERPFGLDVMLRFHRNMGVLALVLLILHPLVLALTGGGWSLLAGTGVPWAVWVGRAALLALLVNVLLSVFQTRMRITFEGWRLVHDLLGPLVLVLGFVHSWFIGEDLNLPLLRGLWIAALGGSVILFLYQRIMRPLRLKRKPYRVEEVKAEAPGVWTVTLSPPQGGKVFEYLPGQFQFITFYRGRGLPVEEHHWTISSSPAREGLVSSTIKALGDFTSTMGETAAGDAAAVQGPFGRFSFLLHPEEHELVFVAGGIGITPVMGMLRYMQDTGDTRDVLLLYGNKTQGEIVFRDELSRIEAGGRLKLRVVHVLSSPEKGWEGETGYVDGEKIMRHRRGELSAKAWRAARPWKTVRARPFIRSPRTGRRPETNRTWRPAACHG